MKHQTILTLLVTGFAATATVAGAVTPLSPPAQPILSAIAADALKTAAPLGKAGQAMANWVILVDSDDDDEDHDDDHKDKSCDDDEDECDSQSGQSAMPSGPIIAPDNGLFNNGTLPTVKIN